MCKFEVGKSYSYRYPTSYETVVVCRVVRRTPKTITFVTDRNSQLTRRVQESVFGEGELVKIGNYSMAPILMAKSAV